MTVIAIPMLAIFFLLNISLGTLYIDLNEEKMKILKTKIDEINDQLNKLEDKSKGYRTSIADTKKECDNLENQRSKYRRGNPKDENEIKRIEQQIITKEQCIKSLIVLLLRTENKIFDLKLVIINDEIEQAFRLTLYKKNKIAFKFLYINITLDPFIYINKILFFFACKSLKKSH